MSFVTEDKTLKASHINRSAKTLKFFSCVMTAEAAEAIASCPNLQELSIACCDNVCPFLPVFEKIASLRVLDLCGIEEMGTKDFEVVARMVQLERLSLRSMSQIKNKIASAIGKMTTLKDLLIFRAYQFSDSDVLALAPMKGLRRLSLQASDLKRRGVRLITEQFPDLEYLNVGLSLELTDAGLAHLPALLKLRGLDITSCRRITDKGFAKLVGIPQLDEIAAGDTQIGDQSLELMVETWPGLKEMIVYEREDKPKRYTRPGMQVLAGLTDLKVLGLCGTDLNDATFARIAFGKKLTAAYLARTRITDSTLRRLSGIKTLETLDVRWCDVTATGARHLQRLKGLKAIDLEATYLEYSDRDELAAALPGANIEFSTRSSAELSRSIGH